MAPERLQVRASALTSEDRMKSDVYRFIGVKIRLIAFVNDLTSSFGVTMWSMQEMKLSFGTFSPIDVHARSLTGQEDLC